MSSSQSVWTHLLGKRSNQPELIDGSDYSRDEYVASLGDLRWVNRSLGGRRALEKYFFPMLKKYAGSRPLRILDVGTGSGDLPIEIVKWASANGKTFLGEDRAHSGVQPSVEVKGQEVTEAVDPDELTGNDDDAITKPEQGNEKRDVAPAPTTKPAAEDIQLKKALELINKPLQRAA